MGNSYYVPRSVKGESRILYIFTIKSFAVTVVLGLMGWLITYLIEIVISLSLIIKLIIIGVFALIGYGISTIIIPDIPLVGPLRKAAGENIGSMLLRAITFRKKRKIYLYNYKREEIRGGNTNEK